MDKDYLELKDWLDATADEPLENMGAFFDERITGYEEHMAPWGEHYRRVAELIPINAGTLLDPGCGTGLELDTIFERFPEIAVTGIDLSEQMLQKLREKHGSRSLTLIKADYFKYELGEELYDAAVSVETLHHFTYEQKRGLFKKLFRCLKPGGVYIECDYIAKTEEIERLTFSECKRRRERDNIPPDAYVHFDTPLTLAHELSAIRAAGFAVAEPAEFLPGDDHTVIIKAVKLSETGK